MSKQMLFLCVYYIYCMYVWIYICLLYVIYIIQELFIQYFIFLVMKLEWGMSVDCWWFIVWKNVNKFSIFNTQK